MLLVLEAPDLEKAGQHTEPPVVAAVVVVGTGTASCTAEEQTGHMDFAAFHKDSVADHIVVGKAGHTGHTFAEQAADKAAGE